VFADDAIPRNGYPCGTAVYAACDNAMFSGKVGNQRFEKPLTQGARSAHIRDGAALCAFLAWLETRALEENPDLDECSAADVLEGYRRYGRHPRDIVGEGGAPQGHRR
jgi:hypothetical protein